MPATVATPAERRNGWTGPVTRSMNSGQWSIASSRPLPSLSSAKSFVPKPLAFVLPASSSRSLKDTVDDLSVRATTSRKDSTPATTPHSRSCFALTSFLSFLGLAPASFLAAFLVWRSPLQGGRRLPVVFITRPCGRSYLSRRALIRREATVPSEPIIPADPRPAATSAQAGTPLPAGDRLPTPVTGPAAPPAAAPAAPTPARVPAAPPAAPAEAPAAAPIALVTGTPPTTGGSVVWQGLNAT